MSDHWNVSNPELYIMSCANGTLLFKICTSMCGIWLWTENSYNNGSWHSVEIYFNGITANPTVKIYVDGNLDTEITHWLCDVSNDEFHRAKIGRRAVDQTLYFDGKIDEFKYVKYPGGNEQNKPVIDGPTHGDPGVEYDFSFVTNDPEGDDIQLYVDWGDGTYEDYGEWYESGEEVILSHEWDEEGQYNITARSRDIWHFSAKSDKHTIFIGNQPPYAPTIDGPLCGDPGVVYEYIFVGVDPEQNDIQYFIDWGDGDSEWTGYYSSGEEATVSHAWDSKGQYEITAKAKDDHDNEGQWSEPFLVRMGDEAPAAPSIDGKTSGRAGVEYEYIFQTTDPEGDLVYYEVQWGDGTSDTDVGPFESGEEAPISHTWEKQNTYTIKARAKDYPCGVYGEWHELVVTMPKNKVINFNLDLFSWLFERFPYAFPILRQILGL